MASETRQSYGWAISIALVSVIGSIVAGGIFDLKGDIRIVRAEIKGIKNDIGAFRVVVARFEGNRFTSSDGLELWKHQAEHQEMAHPPEQWRILINSNSTGVKLNSHTIKEVKEKVNLLDYGQVDDDGR